MRTLVRQTGQLTVAVWALAAGALCAAVTAGEGDWIYNASRLTARFDATAEGKTPDIEKRKALTQMVEELTKLREGQDTTARDGRATATFAAWLSQRIQGSLGNAAAEKAMGAKYRALRDALPQEEAAVFKALFDRVDSASDGEERVCEVETREGLLRVRVKGYPIASAMKRIAQSAGVSVDIPPNVVGIVDFVSTDWLDVRGVLLGMAAPRGLWVREKDEGGYAVIVRDPAYMFSIEEIASQFTQSARARTEASGVSTGYVILHGRYVPPPYQLSMEDAGDRCVVRLNSVAVFTSPPWREPADPLRVEVPQSGKLGKADLDPYVVHAFREMLKKGTLEQAEEAMARFLSGQQVVGRFKFHKGGNLSIWFRDRPEVENVIMLSQLVGSPSPESSKPGPPDAEKRSRFHALAASRLEAIKGALSDNGLVVVPLQGEVRLLRGDAAGTALNAVLSSLLGVARQRDAIYISLFGDFVYESADPAWEIVLGLRSRELIKRWRSDSRSDRSLNNPCGEELR